MTVPAGGTTGTPTVTYDECASCGWRGTLPRTSCPECGAPDPRRRPAGGRGRVAASTVVHRGPDEWYSLVLVDLDEGVRVMGRADPGLVVGAPVQVRVVDGLPTFAARPE